MIELKNVSKVINKQVILREINLVIPTGQLFTLVGPSGSGKTTIIKLINGLIEPTNGQILIDKKDVREMDMQKFRLQSGYVLQNNALFPNLTVAENILIQLNEQKLTKDWKAQTVQKLLKKVDLPSSFVSKYPAELSGGQKQRVSLARAFASQSNLILFDESFSALDPLLREQMQDLVLRLHQQNPDITMIFITHDMKEALKISDKIAVIRNGFLEQVGRPKELLKQPATEFVNQLFCKETMIGFELSEFITSPYVKEINLAKAPVIQTFNDLLKLFINQFSELKVFKYLNHTYQAKISDVLQFMILGG